MNDSLLKEFAELKIEEKRIKVLVDEKKTDVLAELRSVSADEVTVTGYGVLTVVSNRAYTYPQAIVQMEEDLKLAKKEAEAKGTATYTDNPFVKFNALKE